MISRRDAMLLQILWCQQHSNSSMEGKEDLFKAGPRGSNCLPRAHTLGEGMEFEHLL